MKTNLETHQNYRSYIRDVLIEKQKKNPKFSLRSFAKMLGVQSSFLSMVLNGKRDLSEETASLISEKLNLNSLDSKKLILLLRLEKTVHSKQRSQILEDLEVLDPSLKGKRDLAVDQFRAISEWYHLPLQLLVVLPGFEWSEEAAAKELGITVYEVREALERLSALELIEWIPGEKPKKAEGRLMVSSPFKNEALKKYHTQMLEKNITALTEQEPAERFTGTMNLAFDENGLQEAHVVLKEAMEKLAKIADKKARSKKIYHANLNIFRITQNQNSNSVKKSKGQKI